MVAPKNQYSAPTTVIFAALAVACAGLGGLAGTESHRNLFAAAAGFWWLMLLIPQVFMSTENGSHMKQSALSAAHGALGGLCFGLCFASAAGWKVLLDHTTVGAAIGFASYWLWLLRTRPFQGDG